MYANFFNAVQSGIPVFSFFLLFFIASFVPIILTRKLFKNKIVLLVCSVICITLMVILIRQLVFYTVILPLSILLGFIALIILLRNSFKAYKLGKNKVIIFIPIILLVIYTFLIGCFLNVLTSQRRYLEPTQAIVSINKLKDEFGFTKYKFYSYQGRDTLDITLKEQPTVENITDFIDTIVTELENSYEITKKSSQKGSDRLLKVILRYNGQEYLSGQFFRNFKSSDGKLVFDRIYLNDVNINKLEVDISQYE